MAHTNTILSQLLAHISRHESDQLAARHHQGQKFRAYNRWSQFPAMPMGQLSGRKSLRDITFNLKVQAERLYRSGMKPTATATLARVNARQPASLYQKVFTKLLQRCQMAAPKHRFSFQERPYLLDATTLQLCPAVSPWAEFRQKKGGIELHMGLDAGGYLAAFLNMSKAKAHEINWAGTLRLPQGSFACFDRGFTEYGWYNALDESGFFFVTRLKGNAGGECLQQRPGRKSPGISREQLIRLAGVEKRLRLVRYIDLASGVGYEFITSAHHLKGSEIDEICTGKMLADRAVFQVDQAEPEDQELSGDFGQRSAHRLWVALRVYLLVAFLNFKARLSASVQQILRLLQFNLFSRRDLIGLFQPPSPQPTFLQNFHCGILCETAVTLHEESSVIVRGPRRIPQPFHQWILTLRFS